MTSTLGWYAFVAPLLSRCDQAEAEAERDTSSPSPAAGHIDQYTKTAPITNHVLAGTGDSIPHVLGALPAIVIAQLLTSC